MNIANCKLPLWTVVDTDPLLRREAFAVSLRSKKKAHILQQKRSRIYDQKDTLVSYVMFPKFKSAPAYFDQIIQSYIPNNEHLPNNQKVNCLLNAIVAT